MNPKIVLWSLYLVGVAATIAFGILAVLTWRRRRHPVAAAMCYCAAFSCAMTLPLKFLFWFSQHPGAYKAYFYIYWTHEPISDVLVLVIGYRLICYLCDSAMLRRMTLWLFGIITFFTIGSLLFFLFSSLNPHPVLKTRYLSVMECCLHLAMCGMVFALVISRKSLGPSTDRPLMQIALALGIMSACSLIGSTLVTFIPKALQVGGFAVLHCIEAVGAVAGTAMWCFAVVRLDPSEDRKCSFQPATLILSRNSLNTAGELLMEIVKR
jgi:hypothetical protein